MAGPNPTSKRPWLVRWIVCWAGLIAVQWAAAVLPGTRALWASPVGLFVIVTIAASLCAVAAVTVLVVAHRQDLAELGLVGAFGFSVSVLPLVHGLTVPGVLYGPNPATMSSVLLALPLASVAVVPLVAPRAAWSIGVMRNWRAFVAVHVVEVLLVAVALLVRPSLLPAPTMGALRSVVIAATSLAVCFALSARHLRLSWISRSPQTFSVSIGFAMIGASSLVWVGRAPFTAGFWLAHALDIVGVFLLTIGAVVTYRQRRSLRSVIRPLVANEPLSAFALGLDPLVHRFVASLETKDPITRDHVVRTAALAMRVCEALHLSASELHVVGLGALLHDVGKLYVEDAILQKPGRLEAHEYEAMKRHTEVGEALVLESVVLAEIGPIVRGHHERLDGNGYPDRLAGAAIPLAARIVSVCDAYDAMAHTRHYRVGMGDDRALAILREHAGSQWDPVIVDALISVVRTTGDGSSALDDVGRLAAFDKSVFDESGIDAFGGCADALPMGLVSGEPALVVESSLAMA